MKFNMTNNYMLGHVVGERGVGQRSLQAKHGVKINISDNSVCITGQMNNVKNAEKDIFAILQNQSFEAEISDHLVGQIVGLKGSTIKQIRDTSGAHVKISERVKDSEPGFRSLQISGRKENIEAAKGKVMNVLESVVRKDFEEESQHRFKNIAIQEGTHNVLYVQDQHPGNPSLFFLEFADSDTTELYTPVKVSANKKPPIILGRGCAILAPHGDFLYRAICLGIRSSEDKLTLQLKVKFVDFGNVSIVDFFECRDLPKQFLYPALAIPAQLSNLKMEAWKQETLDYFRKQVKSGKIFRAKFTDIAGVNTVKLWIPGIGDLGEAMVGSSLADWIDDPFKPKFEVPQMESAIGSSDMLYATDGWGHTVRMDVAGTRISGDGVKVTLSAEFKSESVSDSIMAAYICSKMYLEKKNNFYLDSHTLHISAQNVDEYQHVYQGVSAGLVIALCIVSESLQVQIPGHIACTGQVSGHGVVSPVGAIREKLLAARRLGKTLVYVPSENLNEALELNMKIDIRPVKHFIDLVNDIWK